MSVSASLDSDSRRWLTGLAGPDREATAAEFHPVLLRIARGEVRRRSANVSIGGPELDDLAHQAAADALVTIIGKLDEFRGESRFTTWAYKFVMFEVSSKIGRHFWRNPAPTLEDDQWARLPDRFGIDPAGQSEWQELAVALRSAVQQQLTAHQRRVFVAIVVNGVPLDALVIELGSNRNAIYKTMFDARRKLRDHLAAQGYLTDADTAEARHS